MATPTVDRGLELPRLPLIAAAALASAGIVVATWVAHGPSEDGLVLANRLLARLAFLVFFFIYIARPAARLWPSERTRALLRGRRTLGISYGIVQLTHAATIIALFVAVPGTGEFGIEVAVGGTSMLLVAAMSATSNDASVRALGLRWRTLHRVGLHLLWFLYLLAYGGRVAEGQLSFVPLFSAVLVAMGIRVAAHRARA